MNRTLSIYLDLLRFVAACAVFMAHVPMFVGGYLWQLGQWGHQAVVIFFVLSGFVIAFVTDGKERTLTDYAINRASRIYSVAIPALIISIIVFYWALAIKPEVLSAFSHKMLDPFATLLAALTFTNQSWINFSVFANPPYWSLGYEVMYYIFFGVVFYLKGWTRIVLAIITAIAMGPSIVLYAPLWFIGVLTYHKCKNRRASESSGQSLIIFLFTLAAIAFLMLPATVKYINNIAVAAFPETFFDWLISPAQKFLADYVLAVAVALNIYFLSASKHYVERYLIRIETIIKPLAQHTFSLYLFHFPILCAFAILVDFESSPYLAFFSALILTPITVYILGIYTEDKRMIFRKFIAKRVKNNNE